MDTTEDIGYPVEASVIEAKGKITVPARATMVLKQIEPPVYDEVDEQDVIEVVDEAERKKDLGQPGGKKTADAAATADSVSTAPTAAEFEAEIEAEIEAEATAAEATEATEAEEDDRESVDITAKRRAAQRDEYTDTEQ